ncbi:MAG TPA: LLM class flavin-dependent oxidoreductase [Streptosporangiaceae bacterium]|jgi:alkanesulfonate monooxygenase SsuD/methylene tetrahydromethanopterin reductase-like flavin-dependent oxidoreductase (luciferase family)|nr:LLM class flavin-dependent oxidoreductase [Streptosporangiaceae bacterium]
MPEITVGLRVPHGLRGGAAGLRDFVARAEAAGIDRLCAGDHVTFRGGRGFDGLLTATALAMASRRLAVQTAVYLLALRHPVPVARQVAALAELAPGRLLFGVGLGGDDPAEWRACGVDPRTRGRRLDEALAVLRPLLDGAEVTMSGDFFQPDRVRIGPVPHPPVPIIIGGRSDAALRRVARHGDGWLGLWVSPARYAEAVERIGRFAAQAGRPVRGDETEGDGAEGTAEMERRGTGAAGGGRGPGGKAWQHGLHVWCGLGASPAAARPRLAAVMEELYRTPFTKFERYCPCGTPDDIAAALQPYVAAGCRSFNLIPVVDCDVAETDQAEIDGADAVRTALRDARGPSPVAGTVREG